MHMEFVEPLQCFQSSSASRTYTEAVITCAAPNSVSLGVAGVVVVTLFVFIASTITGNNSWVDRLWSIYPVAQVWIHCLYSGKARAGQAAQQPPPVLWSSRTLFAPVITLWGVRLTYNFWRKGGYQKGGEDYRWNYVQSWPIIRLRPVWLVFSFFIVSLFQIALLFLITTPVAVLPGHTAPSGSDYVFAALFLSLLAFETIADQQQWDFHLAKHGKITPVPEELVGDVKRGFLTHGLFAFSRHPNVWAEQSMWIVVYLASTVAHSSSSSSSSLNLNSSFTGALILFLLTIYSSMMTETLSSAKYAKYKVYQQITPFLCPGVVPSTAALHEAFKND